MEYQKGICKLCLERHEECRTIDGRTTNVLFMLLPKTDFTVIQGPVVCRNCEEMLIRSYDFKVKCLHTYKPIVPLVYKDSARLNLKDVYLSKNPTGTGIPDDQDICGLCTSPAKNVSAVSLVMLKKMIKLCLPELDLTVIEKLGICSSCFGSLENCFRFVTNCLVAEEKIQRYCDSLDIDCKGEIELSNVLQFITRLTRDATSGVDDNSVDNIKLEQLFREDKSPDKKIKLEETFFDVPDFEHVNENVKIKNEILMEMDVGKDDDEQQFTPRNMFSLEEGSYKFDFIKTKGLVCEENVTDHKEERFAETEAQQCLLKMEESFNRFEDSIPSQQEEVTTSFYKKQTFLTPNLEEDLTNSHIPRIKMYRCDSCLYQTKFKSNLTVHLQKHKDPLEVSTYKCDSCSYQSKFKCALNKHVLQHKDPSEIVTYKCASCLYQTKYKMNLKKHSLKHKDASEVTTYKCASCLYQTKYKMNLKKHSLKHKDASEVTTYKCASCLFQTKYTRALKRHLLKHKDPSELTVYKCDFCLHQTTRKDSLAIHVLKHKSPSEVAVYKCDFCSYQVNHKDNIKKHLLKHKDASEVTIYKCEHCSYEARRKGDLRAHMLRHQHPSEVTMYKCDSCLYQTKYKMNLKKHFLIHKDVSEVTMYKCDVCLFQTKFRNSLNVHSLKHKDSSEVTMYKCDFCLFQTKYKKGLKVHLLKHKDPSE